MSFVVRLLDQPPRTAGDHPDFPLEVCCHRVANTSERAQNKDRSNASFSSMGAAESIAVLVAGCENSVGAHARPCPPA